MPDFGNKNVFFPHQHFRGTMSKEQTENIVYVEYQSEVKAYDNIHYPSNYVDRIIAELNRNGNRENIQTVWQGGYCAWKNPKSWKKEQPKPESKPSRLEEDDLPF